jgi:hypothetical protein
MIKIPHGCPDLSALGSKDIIIVTKVEMSASNTIFRNTTMGGCMKTKKCFSNYNCDLCSFGIRS